jgi:cation diffusion facilitator family transporter
MTIAVKTKENRLKRNLILLSLVTALVLMGIKFLAYRLTGSASILSDALETIINVVASLFALYSIIIASRPPDEDHPYGHGKIEYFSAGVEGSLIVLAAIGIFIEGIRMILNPHELPNMGIGIGITAIAIVANFVLGYYLIRIGKKTKSLTLIADGKHVMADVYTSLAVIAGLTLVHFTSLFWIDGAVACLVAANVVVSGYQLIRRSFEGLMDTSDPELLDIICGILAENKKDIWIGAHRLRSWKSGNLLHVDLHLILPRTLSLSESHAEVKEVEALLSKYLSNVSDVLVHVNPCIDSECSVCELPACDMRSNPKTGHMKWEKDTLVDIRTPKTSKKKKLLDRIREHH